MTETEDRLSGRTRRATKVPTRGKGLKIKRVFTTAGVRRACQGRPVDEDQLQKLAQQVEDAIRATGAAEVPSHEVGLAILRPLRELDEVAYLRFASVYRAFTSLDDFEKEITELRARHLTAGTLPLPGMQPDPPTGRRRGGSRSPAPPDSSAAVP